MLKFLFKQARPHTEALAKYVLKGSLPIAVAKGSIGQKLLLFIILFASIILPAAAEYFEIDSYVMDITVLENNRYRITETIDVTFSEQRHGIFRTIPDSYYDRPVLIEDITVDDRPYLVTDEPGVIKIRIGDPNTSVAGNQRYIIRYDYDVGKDPFNDMDEFYFNIIGTEWPVNVSGVDFVIRMPKPFDDSKINFTCGKQGSKEKARVDYTVDGTAIKGVLNTQLKPYEGLTIALPLPEGYYVGAVDHQDPVISFLTMIEFPADIIVVVLAFLFWLAWGRDNRLTTVIEYTPPEGMLPSEIGYIIDGTVDSEDIASLIIYMAEKGYLSIEEVGRRNLKLIKERDIDESEKEYVRDFFRALFETYGKNGEVTTKELSNRFYATMGTLKKEVLKGFTDNPERRIFEKNKWPIQLLLSLLVFGVVGKTSVRLLYRLIEDLPITIGISAFVVIFSSIGLYLPTSAFGRQEGFQLSTGLPRIILGLIVGAGPFVGVYFAGSMAITVQIVYILSSLGAAFFVTLFSHIMRKRTEYGHRILERVLGLREFIQRAEADRIKELFHQNPSYYFDILPYAMVLGVSHEWTEHFDGLSIEPPHWYRTDYRDGFRTEQFNDNLTRQFNSLSTSMSSSPSSSSSSSSSGGSSGGGSGGGGGGSW